MEIISRDGFSLTCLCCCSSSNEPFLTEIKKPKKSSNETSSPETKESAAALLGEIDMLVSVRLGQRRRFQLTT